MTSAQTLLLKKAVVEVLTHILAESGVTLCQDVLKKGIDTVGLATIQWSFWALHFILARQA